MSNWNYDMDSCPLDTKVYLLSSNDCFLLPQREYVGTITHIISIGVQLWRGSHLNSQ